MIRRVLILLIKSYQAVVAPALPPRCRFFPSCSQYGIEALREHGPVRGTWLLARRLARCHPFGGCGVDPVPPSAGSQERRDA